MFRKVEKRRWLIHVDTSAVRYILLSSSCLKDDLKGKLLFDSSSR